MTAIPITCNDSVSNPDPGDEMAYDPNELVGSAEIARRLGVKQRTVQIMVQRTRRGEGVAFPESVGLEGGKALWRWGDVDEFQQRRLADMGAGPRQRSSDSRIPNLVDELRRVQQRLTSDEIPTAQQVEEMERSLERAKSLRRQQVADVQKRLAFINDLRGFGWSWSQIAAVMGTEHESTPYLIVKRSLEGDKP